MLQKPKEIIFIVLVIAVGFSVYSNSITNEFVWDDELLIVNNRQIRTLHNIPSLFSTHIAYGSTIESNLYRPLQMISYVLNYAAWGLDVRAYHLTNIIFHILVALILFWLSCLICGNQIVSLIGALLFICHPIHTEAVTYISGRADPLAAFFILLALVFYIKHAQQKKGLYFLVIFCFLCALLCKEIAVVVPLLLLAYDYIYRAKKRISLNKHLPFLSIGIIYIILRKTILNFGVGQTAIQQVSPFQRTSLIFGSLTMYFKKLLLPFSLHMEYAPTIPAMTDIQVIFGVTIAFSLIWIAFVYIRKKRIVTFAITWFLINYLPISNIYPLNAFFAEHWIYTCSIGLFILAGWIIVKAYEKYNRFRWVAYSVLGFLLLGSFSLTLRQNQYWRDPEDFYHQTLRYNPASPRVLFRLGLFYLRKGMADKGIENTKKSLELNPSYIPAYENLASGHLMKGQFIQAIEVAKEGLAINPSSAGLHNSLGIAYSAQGRFKQAVSEFQKGISLEANNEAAYNNLGSAYAQSGMLAEAIAAFKKAIDINPNYAQAHKNLARMYYELRSEH